MSPDCISFLEESKGLRILATCDTGNLLWIDFDRPREEIPPREIEQAVTILCLGIFDMEYPNKRSDLIFDQARAKISGNVLSKTKLKQLARLEELLAIPKEFAQ